MPQDLDFTLYFNIAFFSILGLGLLFGFLRGLKKTMWSFFVTLIFYVFFFLTLEIAINLIWEINLPFLGGLLANISPDLASATSLQEAMPIMLEAYLPAELQDTLTNQHFLELVSSLAIFVVKIAYTIIYFTVIQIIYRLILWIVRIIIFPKKKKTEKYRSKNRGMGALFGLLKGSISLYVTLIIFGGLISISESILNVMPEIQPDTLSHIEYRQDFPSATDSLIAIDDIFDPADMPEFDEAFDLLTDMVTAYNENIVVTTQNQIEIASSYTGENMPLNLYLFDSVLSMSYQDDQIAIREELGIYAQVAGNVLGSEFMESGNLSDISGDDIRDVFEDLSASNLFTSLIPLAVEIGLDYFDNELDITTEELYDISWDEEIMQLGEIAAMTFDIVNAAGILNANMDINTIQLDGDEVSDLFDELGQSELINLAAYVAIEPVLEGLGGDILMFIDVPNDIVWADEFSAIGALAGEILNTGLTIGDVQGGDIMVILSVLSDIDFTILLDSKIVTNAMINILSGATSIDVSFLNVPADVIWLDDDSSGTLVYGELHNILFAVNALAGSVSGLDITNFENLNLQTIADLDPEDINTLFESRILVATLTDYIGELSFGDFSIIMPDSVFDADDYLIKTELQKVVRAAHMALTELTCDVGDTACEELGFDYTGILSLSSANIDTLLDSEILTATVGSLILEYGVDILVVPDSVLTQIFVDGVSTDVVSKTEIKKVFLAVSTLGITDIENIDIVGTGILDLSAEEIDTLLDSDILSATAGSMIIDYGEDVLVIPGSTKTEIFVDSVSTFVVSKTEIKKAFLAISTLGISDIENIEFDISILNNLGTEEDSTVLDQDKADTLFDSVVLNATLSSYLIDFSEEVDAFIVVPYEDVDGISIRVIDSVDGTEYISEVELTNILKAVLAMDIQDINNFETLDLGLILDNASTLLESAILHATVSKQLMDLTDVVVVPSKTSDGLTDIKIVVGTGEEETTYIDKTELEAAFDALSVLGIDDINEVEVNITILNNLATEEDTTVLDQTKADTLFGSSIINATLSKFILDFADEEDAFIVVPYFDELSNEIRIDNGFGTEFVSEDELTNILSAILALDIDDINNIETLGLDTITDNVSVILDSAIMHATISKQLMDLTEVVVVPSKTSDGVTDIKVVVGTGEEETTYIAKTELEAAFDALSVLGINDITEVEVNITILNNLATEEDSTILDQTKADTLFGSSIINATLSKFILDFADEEDAFIVVPYFDELSTEVRIDNGAGTEFVSEDELTNILSAILALDIDDINNIETLGLDTIIDNVSVILDSAIMHATISKQLMDLTDVVVVPSKSSDGLTDIKISVGTGEEETTYIAKTELEAAFNALSVLGINDINQVEVNITILNNLATEEDTTVLDQTKADTLFASTIINATISKFIIDFTEEDEPLIVVPYEDELGSTIVIVDPIDGIKFIHEDELRNILEAILILDIQDFNAVDTLSLSTITANSGTLLDSAILHATISKQILDLGEEVINIPYLDQSETSVRITTGPSGEETEFISRVELLAMFDALDLLQITDINSFSGTIDFGSILSDPDNVDTLLASAAIHATISVQVLDLADTSEGDALLTVPYKDQSGVDIRITVGDALEGTDTEYIIKTEVKAVFNALDVLEINDVESFTGTIDFGSILSEPDNVDTLLESAVIHATISDQVFSLSDSSTGDSLMQVPYFAENGTTEIRVTVGDSLAGTDTEYITKDEIKAIFDALDALEISDIDSFSGSINLSLLSDQETVDTVLASSVIHLTISDQLIDLDDGATIIVPYEREDDTTLVRISVGDSLAGTDSVYISKTELEAIFDALDVLEITDVESFTGNDQLDLSILADGTNLDVVLASAMIQAIISRQVLDLDDVSGAIQVPYFEEDNSTKVRIMTTDIDGHNDYYISSDELKALILSLNVLEMTDVNNFGGTVDLGLLTDPAKKATILSSSVIQATISEQLLNTADGSTFIIPYFEEDTTTKVVIETGPIGLETIYISNQEISDLLDALDILNLTDVTSFDSSSVDFSTFAEGSNASIMMESAIIQAIVSKQLIDLDTNGTVQVPFKDENSSIIRVTVGTGLNEVELVVKAEIVNVILALDMLNVTDPSSYDGTIDLTVFYDELSRNTLLASSIMQATISDQIIGLGSVITVPLYEEDGITEVRRTVGDIGEQTEYILKPEIHALFESLEILGMDSIDDFNGTISLGAFLPSQTPGEYNTNQNILLASASIQATISKQILDLQGSGFLVIPTTDIDDIVIRELVSGTEFIYVFEIKNLINAMDLLGITDINNFTGTVGLTTLLESQDPNYDANQDTMLASAIMHATISDQITNLNGSAIVLPSTDVTGAEVTKLVSLNSYIVKSEVKALLNAMDLLGFSGNLTGFGGAIDLGNVSTDTDQNTLLASAIMHATISDQIIGLDGSSLVVPSTDVLGSAILVNISMNDFVTKAEIKALLNALDVIGISGDLTDFTGTIGLSALFASQDLAYDTNQDSVLLSAIMHATISDQITNLNGSAIVLPSTDVNGVAIQVNISLNDFITKSEVKALLNAMDILGFTGDLNGFGGAIDLGNVSTDTEQNTLLASAIMHATISDQIMGLDGSSLVVPSTDVSGSAILVNISTNDFVTKAEIKALLNALDVIGISGDLTDFTGTIGLSALFASQDIDYDTNQDTALLSAIMHATMTKQITDLSVGGSIVLPTTDINGTPIQLEVSTNDFISKSEVKALLNAMDVLGFTGNLNGFTGAIGLDPLLASQDINYDTNQDIMLASAIMHATMTDQISSLTTIVLPQTDVDGNAIQVTISTNDFITKSEIKALINALDVVGFGGELGSFAGTISIASLDNETDQNTLLLSAIMHATLSDKLLNDTGGNLYIPNIDINTSTTIRITQSGTEFIEKNETKALLTALNEMGLTDYASMTITTTALFASDYDVLLASATMQATISENILSTAKDEITPESGKLLVPTYFREPIVVGVTNTEWIEKVELKNLLTALAIDSLNITDFSGSLSGSAVSGLTDTEIDTLLVSGSMHTTIDYMLKQNNNINSSIPNIAKTNTQPYLTDIITKVEIKAFILATQELGGDISDINISINDFDTLTEGQKIIILDSIIIRCKITPELEAAAILAGTPFVPADYESGALPPTLTKVAALSALA